MRDKLYDSLREFGLNGLKEEIISAGAKVFSLGDQSYSGTGIFEHNSRYLPEDDQINSAREVGDYDKMREIARNLETTIDFNNPRSKKFSGVSRAMDVYQELGDVDELKRIFDLSMNGERLAFAYEVARLIGEKEYFRRYADVLEDKGKTCAPPHKELYPVALEASGQIDKLEKLQPELVREYLEGQIIKQAVLDKDSEMLVEIGDDEAIYGSMDRAVFCYEGGSVKNPEMRVARKVLMESNSIVQGFKSWSSSYDEKGIDDLETIIKEINSVSNGELSRLYDRLGYLDDNSGLDERILEIKGKQTRIVDDVNNRLCSRYIELYKKKVNSRMKKKIPESLIIYEYFSSRKAFELFVNTLEGIPLKNTVKKITSDFNNSSVETRRYRDIMGSLNGCIYNLGKSVAIIDGIKERYGLDDGKFVSADRFDEKFLSWLGIHDINGEEVLIRPDRFTIGVYAPKSVLGEEFKSRIGYATSIDINDLPSLKRAVTTGKFIPNKGYGLNYFLVSDNVELESEQSKFISYHEIKHKADFLLGDLPPFAELGAFLFQNANMLGDEESFMEKMIKGRLGPVWDYKRDRDAFCPDSAVSFKLYDFDLYSIDRLKSDRLNLVDKLKDEYYDRIKEVRNLIFTMPPKFSSSAYDLGALSFFVNRFRVDDTSDALTQLFELSERRGFENIHRKVELDPLIRLPQIARINDGSSLSGSGFSVLPSTRRFWENGMVVYSLDEISNDEETLSERERRRIPYLIR